jgi:hypothetical protein
MPDHYPVKPGVVRRLSETCTAIAKVEEQFVLSGLPVLTWQFRRWFRKGVDSLSADLTLFPYHTIVKIWITLQTDWII